MAKQRGPVASTFSGRVGNIVGAKMKGGEYVTRTYQPSVKNPNTKRQQAARYRLSVCSDLAARLSAAIKAGYAMAAASSRLFERNMFLKEILPNSFEGILTTNDTVEIQHDMLPISKQAGIAIKPVGTQTDPSGSTPGSVTISNLDNVEVSGDERAGLVCVVADDAFNDVRVIYSEANNVEVPIDMTNTYSRVYVWAFFKAQLKSRTSVATGTEPWLYPSRTSACSVVGVFNS